MARVKLTKRPPKQKPSQSLNNWCVEAKGISENKWNKVSKKIFRSTSELQKDFVYAVYAKYYTNEATTNKDPPRMSLNMRAFLQLTGRVTFKEMSNLLGIKVTKWKPEIEGGTKTVLPYILANSAAGMAQQYFVAGVIRVKGKKKQEDDGDGNDDDGGDDDEDSDAEDLPESSGDDEEEESQGENVFRDDILHGTRSAPVVGGDVPPNNNYDQPTSLSSSFVSGSPGRTDRPSRKAKNNVTTYNVNKLAKGTNNTTNEEKIIRSPGKYVTTIELLNDSDDDDVRQPPTKKHKSAEGIPEQRATTTQLPIETSKITSAKQHVEDQPKQPVQTATKTPIILVGNNKTTADIIKKLLDLNPDVRSHLESTLLAAYNEQNAKPKTPATTEQQPVPGATVVQQPVQETTEEQQPDQEAIEEETLDNKEPLPEEGLPVEDVDTNSDKKAHSEDEDIVQSDVEQDNESSENEAENSVSSSAASPLPGA
jgi:hypothetical protein